jgi:hypothetical protein
MVLFVTIACLVAMIVSAILDAESSEKVFKLGGWETNPIFGSKQPTRLRFYLMYLLLDGGRFGLAAILSHGLRVYGHPTLALFPTLAMAAYLSEEHFRGFLGNRKIYTKK